jgi:hypothetical protein
LSSSNTLAKLRHAIRFVAKGKTALQNSETFKRIPFSTAYSALLFMGVPLPDLSEFPHWDSVKSEHSNVPIVQAALNLMRLVVFLLYLLRIIMSSF